jgi:hypothetical protein
MESIAARFPAEATAPASSAAKQAQYDLARCNNAARCGEYNVAMKSTRE